MTDNLTPWTTWADPGYQIVAARDATTFAQGNASMSLTVGSAAGDYWGAVYMYKRFGVTLGKEYTVSFYAKADRSRELNVWVQKSVSPWTNRIDFGAFPLTSEWQRFELPIAATGSDTTAMLEFGLGQSAGKVWIDDVRLQQGNRDIWRRDFEHGVALVNATQTAATVDLGGSFRKIDGIQDRTVNDGSLVTRVTIPAQDGIVLLKP